MCHYSVKSFRYNIQIHGIAVSLTVAESRISYPKSGLASTGFSCAPSQIAEVKRERTLAFDLLSLEVWNADKQVKKPICLLSSFAQNNASKLLLAIMESRHDSENAERILYNMRPKELVCVQCKQLHSNKQVLL